MRMQYRYFITWGKKLLIVPIYLFKKCLESEFLSEHNLTTL